MATNISGRENVVRAARRLARAHTLVGVSTDKACKPINVMGMTKAIQERILVEGNLPIKTTAGWSPSATATCCRRAAR